MNQDYDFKPDDSTFVTKAYNGWAVGQIGTIVSVDGDLIGVRFRPDGDVEMIPRECLYVSPDLSLHIENLGIATISFPSGKIKGYKRMLRSEPKAYVLDAIREGDICRATLDVEVRMTHVDNIAAEFDDDGNTTAYESGWVMEILPTKPVIYNGQPLTFLHSTAGDPKK